MALVQCSKCGEKISDTSKNCIHCGNKLQSNILVNCPECGNECEVGSICKNCGYKIKKKKNIRKIIVTLIFGMVMIATILGIIVYSMPSKEEKIIKISVDALHISEDEEIRQCLINETAEDREYYVYIATNSDEYMAHVIDGKVESKTNGGQARLWGVRGNAAQAEFVWSEYNGRQSWTAIHQKVLKRIR